MDVDVNRPLRWLPSRGVLRGLVAGTLLASGMSALAAPPPRTAILLPPVKLEPGDIPAIARGAIGDYPSGAVGSTPVVRKTASAEGPAWLSGVDPNVVPASSRLPVRSTEGPAALAGGSRELPPLTPSKLANSAGAKSESAIPPNWFPRTPDNARVTAGDRAVPPAMSLKEPPPPDPNTPLRGMATNGAPVMAGPPAYRWYGYGSVTPGANVYAPSGQYPKASANWYNVTGATPGAFPVPVVNPYRGTPGNEPPSYVANAPARAPLAQPGIAMSHENDLPRPSVPPQPVGVRPSPALNARSPMPAPGVPAMPPIGSIGTGTAPPQFPLPPLPQPVSVPQMPNLPASASATMSETPIVPSDTPIPAVGPVTPLSVLPVNPPAVHPAADSVKKPIVGLPVVATKPAEPPAKPEPLPPALRDDSKWKPTSDTHTPAPPGAWAPAATPALPPPDLFLEPGAKQVKPEASARGQMPDSSRPDPAVALVQSVCKGRANGVDVRWTASKKLTVCFEVRSQPEAAKLVRDISARPELAPLAIDFCVVVK